ncbi:MAG: hypothetical protein WCL06_05410 [Bacteroidota bacterium]
MKKRLGIVILVFSAFWILSSCHKDSNGDSKDVSQVITNNTAELASNDVFKMFLYNMIAAEDSIYHPNDTLNFHYTEPCLQMGIAPYDTTWPQTITLAFPESGCNCFDGNVRGGQIIITAKGFLDSIGSEFIVTLSNYTVNGITINGTKKLKVSKLYFGKPVAFTDSSGFQLTSASVNIVWNAEHYVQWVNGVSTQNNISDDLFIYSGTCSSVGYTGTITNALRFINYCFWIGSGSIEITPDGLSKRQVTFLDSCVNQADVVINNETFRVTF